MKSALIITLLKFVRWAVDKYYDRHDPRANDIAKWFAEMDKKHGARGEK